MSCHSQEGDVNSNHRELYNFFDIDITSRKRNGYPQLFDYLAEKTDNLTGKGGCSTFVDAPWFINCNVPLQPVAPDQLENTQFMWFYGLHANNCGTYVKKPMTQCSGEEIMREFLYYCGLEDKIEVGDLPKVNPLKLPQTMHEIVEAINQIPPVPEYYSERKENQ